MKVYCKSTGVIAEEKPHGCKGCVLGWTPSFDGKFTSALGYCLPASVRWTSLAVLAYQFESRILLCRGVKSYEARSFNEFVSQTVCVSCTGGVGVTCWDRIPRNPGGICSEGVSAFITRPLMLSLLEKENLQKIKQVNNLTNLWLASFCVACIFLMNWITKFALLSYTLRMLNCVGKIGFMLLRAPQQQPEDTAKCTCTVEMCVIFYMMVISPKIPGLCFMVWWLISSNECLLV